MLETQTTPRCPRCSSPFVRRTRPLEPHEYLLYLVHLSVCQCQVCARRFMVRQPSIRPAIALLDRRHYHRLMTRIPVTFSGEGAGEGVVTDLSLAGCRLQIPAEVAVGARLRLYLRPADVDYPIVVEHAVVRSAHPTSAGVRFMQFAAQGRERLSRLVRALLTAQPQLAVGASL